MTIGCLQAAAIKVAGQGSIYIRDIKGSQDRCYLEKIKIKGCTFGLGGDPAGSLWVLRNQPTVYKGQIYGACCGGG